MDKKQALIDRLQAQLSEWDGHLQIAKARVAKAGAKLELDGIDAAEAWALKRAEAARKLEALKTVATLKWESATTEVDKLWSDLKAFVGRIG